MITLVLAAMAVQTLAFNDKPVASELLAGDKAFQAKKSVVSTIGDARQPIGRWFDGKRRINVEEAIWLSPAMVSRWIGWLQAREGWKESETQQRWDAARRLFDGKLSFVVKLYAFPKLDVVFEEDTPAKNIEDLEDARGVVSFGGDANRAPERSRTLDTLLQKIEAHDDSAALGVRWDSLVPLDTVFMGTFGQPVDPDSMLNSQIGDYRGSIWLLQCDLPKALQASDQFELQILTAHKTRRATFKISEPPPKSERKKKTG